MIEDKYISSNDELGVKDNLKCDDKSDELIENTGIEESFQSILDVVKELKTMIKVNLSKLEMLTEDYNVDKAKLMSNQYSKSTHKLVELVLDYTKEKKKIEDANEKLYEQLQSIKNFLDFCIQPNRQILCNACKAKAEFSDFSS